jgi:alpha-L-fucosidase
MADEFKRTQHPDAQWFGNAGLGLFLHWGIASVHGNLELSWAMMANVPWQKDPKTMLTPEEYFKLAERFQPDKYDPDRWLRAAKAMGCAYAVLTTRHHDGFALWPSSYGDFSTLNYLQGRDLVKPFVEACRKNGLKVGLYYSPPDWHYNRDYMSFNYAGGKDPSAPWFDVRHEAVEPPKKPAGWDARYKAYIKGQVEELLTKYGKIDVLWFDGGSNAISIDRIRELQPGIVINNRMHGYGDFVTPEWNLPEQPPAAGWWENCASWIGGWGYKANEWHQSAAWMLTRLIQVRAWGGNLLINVGPRPNGELPDVTYARMKEVAGWMRHSRESVFGTSAGPWPSPCNVPVTVNGNVWYLHALPEFKDAIVVTGVEKPARVALLRTGRDLDYTLADGRLEVRIPDSLRTSLPDVVRVQWQ